MKIKTKPAEIFQEFERCTEYNNSIGLYETVQQNERFYNGNQWEGLIAPDLDKPVLNFLKRVCSFIVAMLVSDDIAVEMTPFKQTDEAERQTEILTYEIERVIEQTKMKAKMRELLRNCAVDGDACFYWYYDTDSATPRDVQGEVMLEIIDNTKVLFGNPFEQELQKQPYILIVRREQLAAVRDRAERFGQGSGNIKPDHDSSFLREDAYAESDLVTVLMKLYKQDGVVFVTETTRDAVIRPVTETGYRQYPVSYMSWERVKNSYHGQAIITGLIPNQIAVNKLWAMAIHHQHTMAFPKIFYDRLKIKEWTNRVGEAIGVAGNPNEVVANSFVAQDMSAQLIEIVNRTIEYTKEFMGASDAALGNVKPDNASAIIAVQKATAAPLELQRLALYQFLEDSVRIVVDIIAENYGQREVRFVDGEGKSIDEWFDFGTLDVRAMSLNVNIGASAYWSELTQLGTLDNLFARGVIDDALVYLDSIPDSYVRNKAKIMRTLRERMEKNGEQQMPLNPTKKEGTNRELPGMQA